MSVNKRIQKFVNGSTKSTWYKGKYSIEHYDNERIVCIYEDDDEYNGEVINFPIEIIEKFLEDYKNDT